MNYFVCCLDRGTLRFSVMVFVLALLIPCVRGNAQWVNDPAVNLTICSIVGDKGSPVMLSDGTGGAIICWQDKRNGTDWDLYAQRVNSLGVVLWQSAGVPIDTGRGDQIGCQMASDGLGGAFLLWYDGNPLGPEGQGRIYAQHLDASGNLLWQSGGIKLFEWTFSIPLSITEDGAGGAIVAWALSSIYVQRITSGGTCLWGANGTQLANAKGVNPKIVSDMAGGAIVGWEDNRGGGDSTDIYAQRISPSGTLLWNSKGVLVSDTSGKHSNLIIISDNQSGAILAWWQTGRIGEFAQRIDQVGDAKWGKDGVKFATSWSATELARDSTGGMFAVGELYGSEHFTIYAQHVNSSGVVEWGASGIVVAGATGPHPQVIGDGGSGAIVAWWGFVQHYSYSADKLWGSDGKAIFKVGGGDPTMISDGMKGAIISWRSGIGQNWSIFAKRVGKWGDLVPQPMISSVRDVPNDQGGKVVIRWRAADLDTVVSNAVQFYSIWRALPPSSLQKLSTTPLNVIGKDFSGKAYRELSVNGTPYYWEWVANQPKHNFAAYSFTASTLYDSMTTSNGRHFFLVSTHTSDPNIFWDSQVDSGYSVDNLPPAGPKNLAANYVAGTVLLHWNPSPDSDLRGYEVYRSTKPQFNLDTAHVYAAVRDTLYADAGIISTPTFYYAVRAVDIHGNGSGKSNEVVISFVAVRESDRLPEVFSLSQNYPNPFNPSTVIRYGLPTKSHVTLTVYNSLGQQVEVLLNEEQEAAYHEVKFENPELASGIYFYRMSVTPSAGRDLVPTIGRDGQVGSFVETKKLLILR